MKVSLYVNTAENNRLDKTAYLEHIMDVEGFLRDSASVLTPVIQFEFPNMSDSDVIDEDDEVVSSPDSDIVMTSTLFYSFNYVYIEEFSRFYFVHDVTIVRSHLFLVSLVCDPLMSFKDSILALNAYIERNEFDFSPMLEDTMLPFEFDKVIEEDDTLDLGELVNTHFKSDFAFNSFNIVITCIYQYGYSSQYDISAPTGTSLNNIKIDNYTSPDAVFTISPSKMQIINENFITSDGNNASFVKSLIALPYEPRHGYETDIRVGKDDGHHFTSLGTNGFTMSRMSDYIVIADFIIPEVTDFYELTPYTNYELFIPFLGWISLNIMDVQGSRVLIYYSVNYADGSATAYVWNETKSRVVFSSACQLGVKLSVNVTNGYEIKAQEQSLGLNLAVGLISSALSVGAGAVTHNPMMIAGGVMGATKAITNHINSNARLFERASASFSGSASGLYSPLKACLRKTRMIPRKTLDVVSFAHQIGRPLRTTKNLTELHGFTLVTEIHLENLNAFKREKEEIERLLKSGVIL